MIEYNLTPLAVAVTTLGGAWLTIRKIAKDAEKSKKEQAAEILQEAKEADSELRIKMDAKIHALEAKLKSVELSFNKDIDHLKESYSAELKNLSEKIEQLREQLNAQHSQLLSFLTKLIEKQ